VWERGSRFVRADVCYLNNEATLLHQAWHMQLLRYIVYRALRACVLCGLGRNDIYRCGTYRTYLMQIFLLFVACLFLQSIYYPTNALRDATHMTCISHKRFRHGDAIRKDLLRQMCTSESSYISLRDATHMTCMNYHPANILVGWLIYLCWNNSLRMAPSCRNMYELWWLMQNAGGECRICCTSSFSVAQWGPKRNVDIIIIIVIIIITYLLTYLLTYCNWVFTRWQ
jgi:hypothetical protein